MYRVVLGLEVLGNPVGFVKGLKEGTVGLFYHPLQVCASCRVDTLNTSGVTSEVA